MIRFLVFLALVLAAGWAFAWLADRPGDLVLTFAGMRYETSLTTALALFLALVVTIMVGWWLIRSAIDSPQAVRRYFRARRRDRGYQALSTGLIAAGSGNGAAARQLAVRAHGFLSAGQEPLLPYLDAQVALLDGRPDEARKLFEGMLADGETRTLGLRGLYLEAERVGDQVAARHYAERALETAPQLQWAADAALAGRAIEGDWDKALALSAPATKLRAGDPAKAAAERRRAVLLTAKALSLMESAPADARTAALEAVKLAPTLTPAAVAAARAHFRLEELKKGVKVLEAAWKAAPHPDIADAYVHARTGDAAQDRLARARELTRLQPGNPDGMIAVAQAALAARDFKEARREVEAVLKTAPRESAWLLLADIEDAETGHEGRVREWLQRAVRAPRDAAWTADGRVSPHWLPVSPWSGRLDAFEWITPVAALPGASEAGAIDGDVLARVVNPEKPEPVAAAPVVVAVADKDGAAPAVDAETALRNAGFEAAEPQDEPKPARFRLF